MEVDFFGFQFQLMVRADMQRRVISGQFAVLPELSALLLQDIQESLKRSA
jgi:hypothetical protein